MAQRTGEFSSSTAPEMIPTSVSPSFTLAPSMPLLAQVSHPLVHGEPLFSEGHWQTFATLEPITESISVIVTRASETLLTTTPPQGFVIFDTHSTMAVLVIGSLLSRPSVPQLSSASSPLFVPPFCFPANKTPAMQSH